MGAPPAAVVSWGGRHRRIGVGSATHLRFLLFPPLAAIGFALFLEPYHRRTSLRSVVIGPVAGACIGVVALSWMPAGSLRIVTVTALGIAALYLLHAELTPALAVALLTLLVGASGVAYITSIVVRAFLTFAMDVLSPVASHRVRLLLSADGFCVPGVLVGASEELTVERGAGV